jgi:hypothetical protein
MLDFNSRTTFADHLNQRIDAAIAGERAAVPARGYLGASRLGVTCDRALQFEFTDTPRDPGASLDGRTLRIFEIGHALEEVAVRCCVQAASISSRAHGTADRSAFPSRAGVSAVMSTAW